MKQLRPHKFVFNKILRLIANLINRLNKRKKKLLNKSQPNKKLKTKSSTKNGEEK